MYRGCVTRHVVDARLSAAHLIALCGHTPRWDGPDTSASSDSYDQLADQIGSFFHSLASKIVTD